MICVASYTANLAAFLTKSKMSGTIKNADDLSRQNKVKYGSYSPGTTREFFRVTNDNNIIQYMPDQGISFK